MADQALNITSGGTGALGSGQQPEGAANEDSSQDGSGSTTPTPSAPYPARKYRHSQYAEANANPLPELAVATETEPFPRLSEMDYDDTQCSTRAVVEPDDIGDHRPAAVVYAGEEPTKWRKYRTPVIVALVILVFVLVGTIAGVVIINAKGSPRGINPITSPTSTESTASVSSFSSSIVTSSSVSATASSVPTPSQCADSSGFLTSVSFMGVKGAPGSGGWKTSYCGSASSAKDCCACCYKNKDGCDSWAYMPSSGFAGTSCALIVGWDTGDDKDSTCPAGRGATVYFTTDSDSSDDVGAAGPCGGTDD